MRILIAAALVLISGAAFAAEAEGKIRSIDPDQLTITLADGNSYKLPGELDIGALREGMEVLFAYDEVGGEKLITDMQVFE